MLTIGSLLAQGMLVLSLSVLARLVTKKNIATYQQLYLLYSLISPLLLAGVPAGLLFFISRSSTDEERATWIGRAYLLLAIMGIVSGGAVVALRHPLARVFHNSALSDALLVYAPYLLFAFISAATPPALVASGRSRGAALLNACLGGFLFAALVTAAVISPTGESLAVGLSVASGALALLSFVVALRTVGIRWIDHARWQGLRELMGYGLPLAITGLAGTIGLQMDRVVVGTHFQPKTFAVYALGAVEIPIGLLLGQAVSNVLVPELATRWRAGDTAGMVRVWRESMRKASLLLFPLFAYFMVLAPDVVRVLYGGGYSQSVQVFRIYLFLLPIRIATWGLIPQATGRTSINLYAGLLSLLVNAAVAISLVDPLGISGPAMAAPIAAAVLIVYYLVRVRVVIETPIRELVPVRSLLTIMAIAAAASISLLVPVELSLPSTLRLCAGVALFTPIVIVALRLSGELNDRDWQRVLVSLKRAIPLPT